MHNLYREYILEHYKHPQNFGHLHKKDISVDERNSTCGDTLHLEIRFNTQGSVEDIAFTGDGCAISRASTSLLTEAVKQKTKKEIAQLTHKEVYDLLGVPISPGRAQCALLPLQALRKVLQVDPQRKKL
ncbi:MAG: SUF system NifU family Fe-S cluster assembly protein [Candidatus Kerfeldbacteria bacterium RIFCSPHIGHO2_02_FULL_42_14]|uniref:SUF system NifU family Fe-S cluster assembly protein n=1 Tax=Candidatus Kerfeldbacteria bacterium RIFCSPHIGHO2_02_FULL_42_14 TaxID=1798540 RepID=A0A1G2ASY5_9BACT|nr:MAG: SUF system NifU family Fe-S cluster assembly protein [Candidatus Kerfeldbacteria bacterium RIFCSPHIGHO2_02_FULL_42_14]OGY81623.1 MAG: SUF system NifU family Fe-S cluster assembly protein [Candidatus Kerfeldbacteria bacterium RIFCSPHIGHO2_12_FULL_42_13]OGY83225.1 MAG: SUF system NifU family Fe-S cluster assembly protein [Candidatus Kerfeldbacteria bacterium RIFCSPLOWO2_02_FULL_42_19]OGY85530.1 MAG: SUF system NifU family Fe-S cluster assembly protein [Candidatus Kerfeldbacteria bacterium 